jgi:MFS-type transporter involved in bile tolerance (Atg22 family)
MKNIKEVNNRKKISIVLILIPTILMIINIWSKHRSKLISLGLLLLYLICFGISTYINRSKDKNIMTK